jgi:hypothetical protein
MNHSLSGSLHFFEDVGGGCGPDEGFGVLVVMIDVVFNRVDRFDHVAKNSTTYAIRGKVAKKSFDHVQPGSAGGLEVNVESRMAFSPALDVEMFVGRIVSRS